MAAKFELKSGKQGKFAFNLKAANGRVVLSSETYEDKKAALKGIEAVKKSAANEKRYETLTAKNSGQYFVVKAANGEVIGKSQMYKEARGVKRGIASVMKSASEARIEDLTGVKAK